MNSGTPERPDASGRAPSHSGQGFGGGFSALADAVGDAGASVGGAG